MINSEQAAKYIKAGAVLLSAIGVTISPEDADKLAAGAGVMYSVISTLEAIFFKKTKK